MNRSICLPLVAALFPSVSSASDDDALLEQVRNGHRSARQSIRTLAADYSVREVHPGEATLAVGQYWRSGDNVRIHDVKKDGGTEDCMLANGQCKTVAIPKSGKNPKPAAFVETETQLFHWGDMWRELLIDHTDPNGKRCGYDATLDRIKPVARVRRESSGGKNYVRLDAVNVYNNGYEEHISYWHDIGRNYLIQKLSAGGAAEADRTVAEIEAFTEAAPGVFVPTRCRVDSKKGGKVVRTRVAELSALVVNQPLAATVFTLPSIPAGTILQDTVRGVVGPVGSDWAPQGRMDKLERRSVAPKPDTMAGEIPPQPSTSEPWSSGQVVLAVAGGALVLCVAAMLILKWRSRSAAPPVG